MSAAFILPSSFLFSILTANLFSSGSIGSTSPLGSAVALETQETITDKHKKGMWVFQWKTKCTIAAEQRNHLVRWLFYWSLKLFMMGFHKKKTGFCSKFLLKTGNMKNWMNLIYIIFILYIFCIFMSYRSIAFKST